MGASAAVTTVLSNGTDQKNIRSSDNNTNKTDSKSESEVKVTIVWKNVFLVSFVHLGGIYGLYLTLTGQVHLMTFAINMLFGFGSGLGITAGAHRLWAHKCYKAKLPLQMFLLFFQTVACQNSIHEWVRDHRVHHKYTETHADPHNAKRGFFFSHVGWIMCLKHDDVKTKGRNVDMSDLEAIPFIMFQKKYYVPLATISSFVGPPLFLHYVCGMGFIPSHALNMFRYIFVLNGTWLVNSAAHLYGHKPYDKFINPSDNTLAAFMSIGEGWHNYHHIFPWDYKAAELGQYKTNYTTAFLDMCAWLGLAYDLKTVPEHIVKARVGRTGDGSHQKFPVNSSEAHSHSEHLYWGCEDKDAPKELVAVTQIMNPSDSKYM